MKTKEELKKQYKETPPPMGVYQVKNLINGKVFIGSAINVQGRINRHKFSLKFGNEEVKELLNDYRKYGEENFSFEIIDYLKPKDEPGFDYKEELKLLEEMWIEKLQPFGEKGYNEVEDKKSS